MPRQLRRAVSLRTATALAGGLLAAFAFAGPAMAQATQGGIGGRGGLSEGAGVPGVSSDAGAGGAGGNGALGTGGTGGGGGAGATGGAGGNGGATGVILGGAGGATPGAAGATGGNANTQAGGGGGGAHGVVTSTVPVIAITGGRGGNGGAACVNADGTGACGGAGGGGGAGGYGVVFTGTGSATFANSITGGAGGNGGKGSSDSGGGGDGGYGLRLTNSLDATITGTITGGNGGVVGVVQNGFTPHGTNGTGGAGIVGGDLTLTVRNLVSGGLAGDGVTRGNALFFTGGSNTLNLDTGWGLVGGIRTDGTVTINPGAGGATLTGAISGSGSISTSGALTLTADSSHSGGTTIGAGGSILVGNGGSTGSIGTGPVANSGTLTFNRSGTVVVPGVISGGGTLTQNGSGTLRLSAANTYSGDTVVNAGTIALSNIGGLGSSRVLMSGGATLWSTVSGTLTNQLIASGSSRIQAFSFTTLTYSVGGAGSLAGDLHFGDSSPTAAGTVAFAPNSSTFDPSLNLFVDGGTLRRGGANFEAMMLAAAQVQLASGTTLDLGGMGTGIRKLQGAGTLVNNGGSTSIASGSFSGLVTGTQSLTVGPVGGTLGTLTLSGNNDYSGGTTVNTGATLVQGSASALGTGGVTVNGGTLDLGAYDLQFTRLNHASGSVIASGGGRFSTVSGEAVTIGSGAATDVGFLVGAGSSLTLDGSNALTGGIEVAGQLFINGTGAAGGSGNTIRTTGSVITLADGVDNATPIEIGSPTTQFEVAGSDAATQSGVISDIAPGYGFEKIGSGTLILSAANTYAGTTAISSGVVQVGAGGPAGTLGGGQVSIANGAELAFNRSDNITVANQMTGNGLARQLGAGQLTLSGVNSYAGGTIVEAGTLALGNVTAAGTGEIWLRDGTTLRNAIPTPTTFYSNPIRVDAGESATIDGNTTGGAAFNGAITGGGDLVFTGLVALIGTNSYGATTVDSGSELLAGYLGGGTLGTGNVTNHGLLTFGRSDTATVSNVISGTGDVRKRNGGVLILTGDNDYTGTTTINAATTIQVGNGGTTGTLGTGDVANSGSLVFNRADDIIVANTIGGMGNLTKLGAGTLTLTGNNGYAGTTTIGAGTLQVGNGGTSGRLGAGTVINDAALVFDRSNDVDVTNVISGSGSLTKLGAGTLTLFANNSYGGGTTINAGKLVQGSADAFGTGLVTVDGGALDLGAFDLGLGRLSWLDGGIESSGGGKLVLADGAAYTVGSVGGSISLSVPLLVGPTSTLTILGNNNFTDAITLSGHLLLGAGTPVGAGGTIHTTGSVITYANGTNETAGILLDSDTTQLEVAGTDAATQSGGISETGGSRPLEKIGTGTLILAGSNSYSGGTTISAGTLALAEASSAGGGAITIAGDAALELGVTPFPVPFETSSYYNFFTNALVSTGSGAAPAIVRSGYDYMWLNGALSGGDFAFRSMGTPVEFILGNAANSHASASIGSNVTVSVFDTAALGTGAVDVAAGGTLWLQAGLTLANTLTGAGNLRISSNIQFASANSMTGDTLYESGAGGLQADNALTSGNLVMSNFAYLNLRGFSQTVASLSGTSNTVITNAATPAGASILTISGTGPDSVFAGTLSENHPLTGTLALVKNGANTLTLTGANTYSAGTTITGGVINFTSGGNLGTGGITLAGGGLQWAAGNTTDISSRLNPLGAGGGTFDTNGNDVTFAVSLTGSGGVTKTGSGVLTLTGSNGYLGDTVVTGGLIEFANDGLGTGSVTLDGGGLRWASGNTSDISSRLEPIGSGGVTFDIAGIGDIVAFGSALGGNGGITKAGAGTLILAGDNGYLGTTTIIAGSLVLDNSGSQTLDGLSGAGGVLEQRGGGTTVLSGANSFTGSTVLTSGTLQLDDLSTGYGSGYIEFGAGALRTTADGTISSHLYWNDGATGTLSAAAGTTLTLNGTLNLYGDSVAQFGTATDSGTIVGSFFSGSSSSTGSQRIVIGGGTFRAGAGLVSLALGMTEAVQIDAGATLDINGVQPFTTLNALEGSGTLLNNGAVSMIGAGDFAGTISGSQNVFKVGSGTLILTGDNDYTGFTTLLGGTLELGSVDALSAGQLTLSNASLVVDSSGTLGNLIVSSGSATNVIAAATGTALTLSGTSDFGANSVTRIGNAGNAGTVNFGFSGVTADGSAELFVDAGTLRATNDSLSAITQTIARTEIAAGATLDFNGQIDINGRGGRILNLQGAGRLLNDGENTYLLAGSFAGQIEGSQSVTKLGSGTLILSGANSYSGATRINAGTLQIGDGTTFGTLGSGNVTNNALLAFSGGALETLTVANDIGGGGELSVLGGTVILTGTNSFTGGLTVAGGTLSLGSNSAAGGTGNMITTTGSVIDYFDGIDNATPITIASDTTQLQVLAGAATQSGAIGEDQPLRGFEKIGAGTLVLTASNSYSGGTLVTGGLVNFATGDNLGTGNITLDGGGLQWASSSSLDISSRLNAIGAGGGTFDTNGNDVELASVLSGPGSVTKLGAGTLMLSAINGYLGGTFVSEGTLALGEDGSAGTGAISLADGTRLLTASCGCDPLTIGNDIAIAVGGAATIDTDGYETLLTGTISGGDLTFADTYGGGLFVLTGSNTYGATTIESLVEVQVGDGGIVGSLGTGNVVNDGVLVFDRSDDVTFSQDIGGAGLLVQAGDGTLTLTGTNTYSGGTVIDTGILRIGDGGTTGTLGSGDIDNYGTLVFDRSDDGTIADDIYGDGGITKLGAGTLTLSGFNSYFGTTSVQDGTLAITMWALGSSDVTELGNGAHLLALEDTYVGDMRILPTGGTIDTGNHTLEVFGGVDFQGLLTKTGSGTLVLVDIFENGTGDGGVNVTAGTLGLAVEDAAGTGTIWLADGTTLLNANCGCSNDLIINNDIVIASAATATLNAAGHVLSPSEPVPTRVTLNGDISGGNFHFISPDYVEGSISVAQPAVFVLNGTNSYGQSLIGPNIALILEDGTLGTGNVVFDSDPSDPLTPSTLVFANTADYTYAGSIVGKGGVVVGAFDSETEITLSGSNTSTANFTGTVEVVKGRLVIDGDFGDVIGSGAALLVGGCGCGGDAALGGSGTFHGNVDIADGSLAPGNSPGTLNIAGNLTLGAATILNYELGATGTPGGANNDLVTVGGNLTLDGTLNTIAWGAGYGPGYYRLFNYGGTLTDNALDTGTIDDGLSASVLTNITGQVNVLLGPQVVQYWDGTDATGSSTAANGDGGSGTWNSSGTNWTAAAGFGINDQWRASVGAFAGAAGGTVTVEGTQAFQELRFTTEGYLLRPLDSLARLQTTGGFSIVDVAAGLTADIGVIVQGAAGLTKTGDGTLLLSAVNTYGGATEVTDGTLRLGINAAISNQSALVIAAGATFDLDGFQTQVGSLAGAGAVTLGNGRIDAGYDNSSTVFSGTMAGPDGGTSVFTKNGNGTLTLSGSIALGDGAGSLNSFAQVNAGTLDITSTGSLTADLVQNFSTITNAGTITGVTIFQTFGTVANTGTIVGTTQNFGTFDNNGGTVGTLQSLGGTATNSGTINGDVQTFTSFTSTGIINGSLSNFSSALIEGQLNGEAGNFQLGATITLTGITTGITNYQGVAGSTLDLANFSTTVGALNGNGSILIGTATLTVDSGAPFASFGGDISGSGELIKTGTGEQILAGTNTYGGLTTVSGGTLNLDLGASLAGAVLNSATFHNSGTVNGLLTNDGTATNAGTLASGAVNTGNFGSAGTISVGLQNSGTASVADTIDGYLTNSGIVTATGTLGGITTITQTAAGVLDLSGYAVTAQALTGAGTIQGSDGSLTLTGNASSTFSGTFTGTADLTKNGTGTFTLTGNSTRFGTTTINAGTLQVGAGGAIGALGSGAIVNDAALVVDRTGAITLDGPISGTGTLTKNGAGTLIVLGDNSYSGTTTINDGTLQVGNGGTTGSLGSGAVTNDGTLEFNRGGSVVASNDISGSGNLVKSGSGTLYLSGNNSYSGTTTISEGTLTIGYGPGVGGLSGSLGSGAVFNDGVLVFDRADPITVANTITGSGSLMIPGGNGDVTLTGANGYTGGTQVMGTLRLGHDTAAGTGTIDLAGTLQSTLSFGTLTLANDIDVAAMMPGVLRGADFGMMVLNGSISGDHATFVSASGAPTTFQLNGANSYGDTFIGAAASVVMNSTLGTGDIVVGTTAGPMPAEIYFRNSGDYTIGGTISGAGNVWFQGADGTTVTLSGDNTSGENFTGTVRLNSGNLVIDGDFGDVAGNSANLVVFPNAFGLPSMISGSGVFHGNVDAQGGGIFAPGNSPGTLTIAGNLALGAGSILDYEFGASGVPGGPGNDLISVGGNLTLDGTLNTIAFGAGYGAGYYRLFDYGGTLIDNGLTIGSVAGGLSANVLTNIAGQVNVVLGPQLIQYWDGGDMAGASALIDGDGGAGTWGASTTNWTSPAGFGINDQWRGQIGVFAGSAGGTVDVVGIVQPFQELRFETDGYVLANGGGELATAGGFSIIDVASGLGAEVGVSISGTAGLTKTGTGTLTLSGSNTYTGLTTVSSGTLVLTASGGLSGDVRNEATFRTSGSVNGNLVNNGTVEASGSLNGSIVNNGSISLASNLYSVRDFTQAAAGSLTLNGYGLAIETLAGAGTIDLGNSNLTSYATSDSQFDGTLVGPGQFQKGGTGTLTLGGDSTVDLYAFDGTLILTGSVTGHVDVAGATFRNGGTVGGGVGTNATGVVHNTGAIAGHVTNYGTFSSSGTVGDGLTNYGGATSTTSGTITGLVFNSTGGTFASTGTLNGDLDNYGSATIEGQLNGDISNRGDIVLTGATVGIGLLNNRLSSSVFDLNGFDTALESLIGEGELRLGFALLTVGSGKTYAQFNGVISGTGGVTKVGDSVLALYGANTYTGLTTVSDGILVLGSGGELAGGVQNDARFENEGTVAGLLTNTLFTRNEGVLNGGVVNSGVLDTWGTINGNLVNSGTVTAEGALNGAVVNDNSFTLTGSLSGVTGFTQGVDGWLDLEGEAFAVGSLSGSGVIELDDGYLTVGNSGVDSTFAGEIWGDGGLTKVGSATLTLSGVNGYTGTTTVSAGMLRNTGTLAGPVFIDGGTTFTSTGVVNGALTNDSGIANLSGQLNGAVSTAGLLNLTGTITGIDALTQTAAGTFALNGFNITLGSLAGAGQVQLGAATLTAGGNNSSTSFAGVISGSGALTKTGSGTLTLSGVNSYTGTTTVAGGTLHSSGTLAGPVVNQAIFTSTGTVNGALTNSGTANLAGQLNGPVGNSGTVNLTAAITGIGAFTQTAAGTFALNGFDTTIASLVGGGQVQLGSATLTTGGDNSSTAFAGVVSGSGGLTKGGTGTLTLTGANTFTGVTTIAGGGLQLGSGGTAGSLASSSIVDNGVFTINRSDMLQVTAAISGSGGLIQAGTGTTRLTGANTYTGGTLVSAGRLIGDTTSLQGAIQTNAVLEFAQAGAGTYTGSLAGAGAFEKTGAGLLALTGDSSTFTGATRVLGGQLAVNGLLSRSVVTVGPGATLFGTGTIGGLVAQGGSFVAPGNSVGTLSVAGNVQLLPGSTYQAEITSAAADLISATGTAQVAGTLAVTNLGGTYTLGTSYVIVNAAGGRTGTFDAATGLGSFGTRVRARVVYTPTQVQLLMVQNLLADIACSGPTRNQAGFMAAFDDAVQNGGYDPQTLDALYDLDPARLCGAVDQVSGGIYPAATSAALEEERLVREAAVDRLRFTQDGEAVGTGIWGQLVGAWGHVNSDGTGFDVDNNREGAIFGVDTGGAGWRVGLYGHHIETELDADALASEAHIDRTGIGAYAGLASGPFRARIGASYSDLELSTTRTIAFPGFSAATHGTGDGSMIQGFGELAYRFDLGDETFLEPFADIALAKVDFDAINETGSAVAQLRVAEQEHDIGRAIAGLRGDAAIESGNTRVRLGIDAGLQHNFGDRDVAALIALDGAPNYPFTMRPAELQPWAFVGGGRVAVDFGSNVTATISYRGVLAGNRNDHAASGTLSVRF